MFGLYYHHRCEGIAPTTTEVITMTKTKLTKSVRSTIRDLVEKQGGGASPAMRRITASVIRESLHDDHGIVVRLKTLLRIVERVA